MLTNRFQGHTNECQLHFLLGTSIPFHNGSSTNYMTGHMPWHVISDDFNRDKIQDLAIANYGSGSISIILGNENGTFHSQVVYNIIGAPTSIISADFNNDGYLDILTTNDNDGSVFTFFGIGNGMFRSPVRILIRGNRPPSCITSGDFNQDGILDIVTCDSFNQSLNILFGKGNGAFKSGYRYSTIAKPTSIISVDFNSDNYLDLAVAMESANVIMVLFGDKNGFFSTRHIYNVTQSPHVLIANDFNNDKKLDLAIVDKSSSIDYPFGYITILVNNGDDTFQNEKLFRTDGMPTFLTSGDFNNDGNIDIAVIFSRSNIANIWLGDGNVTFQSQALVMPDVSQSSVTTADFNNDGRLDLAITHLYASSVAVFLNMGVQNDTNTTYAFKTTFLNLFMFDHIFYIIWCVLLHLAIEEILQTS